MIDLIRMKAIYWDMETQGMKFEYREIPPALLEQAKEYRAKMIEGAAEANDDLMHKYLDGVELSEEEIRLGLRLRSVRNEVVLCMCGTAFKNKGVQALLDAVIEFMPSPIDMPDVKGLNEDGDPDIRKASDEAPFSALAFKILNDPFVGNLTFFRVYSGMLNWATPCTCRPRTRRSASGGCCRCTPPIAPRSRKCAPATSPPPWA